MMRYLIINADGYGFTEGISCAIEECVEFGTVRSISANVNFDRAEGLSRLVRRFPHLSVGCHLNPVVGRPLSDPARVKSLLNGEGEFLYREFARGVLTGKVRKEELREEMIAQIERTRALAGDSFSHVDFHMGLHRLPGLYEVFLRVACECGVPRIRTHRYLMGMESRFPRARHLLHMVESPTRIPKYWWNLMLRRKAMARGFAMPDRWVGITNMSDDPRRITVDNYRRMLRNLPQGVSEFVVHPGYVDEELRRWSTYHDQRTKELQVLVSEEFKTAIRESDVKLKGYRDIPLRSQNRL